MSTFITALKALFLKGPKVFVHGIIFQTFDEMVELYKVVDGLTGKTGSVTFTGCSMNFYPTPEDYRGKEDADLRLNLYKQLMK
jgi:hypothetical protein